MFLLIFLVFLSNKVKTLIFKNKLEKNHENCYFTKIILYLISSLPSYPILPQMVGLSEYTGFHIPKIWKILKNYAGPFHQALTSFIWRVTRLCNLLERSFWQHYPGFELKTRSLITRNPHRFTVFFLKRHKSVILESATSDGFDLWNRVFLTWNQNRKWGWKRQLNKAFSSFLMIFIYKIRNSIIENPVVYIPNEYGCYCILFPFLAQCATPHEPPFRWETFQAPCLKGNPV